MVIVARGEGRPEQVDPYQGTPTASNSKLIIIILHWVKGVTLKVAFSIKTDSIEFTCAALHGQFI
jgi:hypothetical protein